MDAPDVAFQLRNVGLIRKAQARLQMHIRIGTGKTQKIGFDIRRRIGNAPADSLLLFLTGDDPVRILGLAAEGSFRNQIGNDHDAAAVEHGNNSRHRMPLVIHL